MQGATADIPLRMLSAGKAAGIFDARWLAGASEPALALALSSGCIQLVLVRAQDEQCSLKGHGAVNVPSSAMVLSLDVSEKEAACMAASTSAGELAIMKVAMCAVFRELTACCVGTTWRQNKASHSQLGQVAGPWKAAVCMTHCLVALHCDTEVSIFGRSLQ